MITVQVVRFSFCKAPWELPDDTLTGEWPEEGAITFNQYGTRYRPGLDLVLNKLYIDIQPNEKVRSAVSVQVYSFIEYNYIMTNSYNQMGPFGLAEIERPL